MRLSHYNVVKICNGIMFDFYPGLPYVLDVFVSIVLPKIN